MSPATAPLATRELRALFIYDTLPTGCIAVPVTTADLAPHLRPGEFAIVDAADREPVAGELFLVGWTCLDRHGREQTALCQAYRRQHEYAGKPFTAWWVGSLRNRLAPETTRRLVEANRWDALGWSNGPYRDGVLEEQLRGRVVGILAPAFEEPKRLPFGGRGAA